MSMDATDLRSIDETARKRFEAAWRGGAPVPIESCLPPTDKSVYLPTLEELVLIDLEFHWRNRKRSADDTAVGDSKPRLVEDYVARFPQLSDPTVLLRLLRQEFQVRRRYGDAPSGQEYNSRFPQVVVTGKEFDVATTPAEQVTLPSLPGYQIEELLGRGGMGVVYRARQVGLNRPVAIKMILSGPLAGPEELNRFRAEAETVAQLQHPNIVQIYEIGTYATPGSEPRPFMALEYVPGGSLDRCLNGTPQPPQATAKLMHTLGVAVEAAHARGIIHRDLKPANILLSSNAKSETPENIVGTVPKISDFGLAKRLEAESGQTKSGDIVGTPSYMAPEQARGKRKLIGPPTDVYALGTIMYELLTGRPPFRGETPIDTIEQLLGQEPVPPRQLQPRVPRDLETICLKCLQKEPTRRYATAAAFADDLDRFLNDQPILARPVGPWGRLRRWSRRNPVVASLLILLFLVLAGGLGGMTYLYFDSQASAQAAREQRDNADASFRDAKNAVDECFTLTSQSEILQGPGMQPVRQQLYGTVLKYYNRFLEQRHDDPNLRAEFANTHYRVGRILIDTGKVEEAMAAYERAQKIYSELLRERPRECVLRHQRAATATQLAQLHRIAGRGDVALNMYLEAKQDLEGIVREQPDNDQFKLSLGKCLGNLTMSYRDRADHQEALTTGLAARTVFDELIKADPKRADYQHELALSVGNLAQSYFHLKQNAEGVACLRQAIGTYEQLVAAYPAQPEHKYHLAISTDNLAVLYIKTRNFSEAEKLSTNANTLFKALVDENPANQTYRLALAINCQVLADVHSHQGQFDKGLTLSAQGRDVLIPMLQKNPSNQRVRFILMKLWQRTAENHVILKQPAEAAAAIRACAELRPRQPEHLADAAASMAICVAVAPEGDKRKYTEEAVELLRRAIAAGLRDAALVDDDQRFETIRQHPDFVKLLGMLRSKP